MIQAQNSKDFKEWDDFVINNPKGNHLVLSDWLESYSSYGFTKEILFIKEDGAIIAGYGAVIAQFSIFKFYIIPYGPIVENGYENKIPFLIEEATKRAVSKSCCYFQISVPKSNTEEIKSYSYATELALDKKYKEGKLFKYIYAADGVNYVDLKDYNFHDTDELLMKFSSSTRRHIKKAVSNIDSVNYAKTKDEIMTAYNLCVLNADKANYSVRSWKDIKESLFSTIYKNNGIFLTMLKDGNIIGSGYFINSGKHLTYLFGGTIKTSHDISTGYALHWEAIKLSLELGFEWYNISLGGSKGVMEFKSKFNSKEILYENAHYHLILNSFKFKSFMFVEKKVKPYKATIAKWLSRIK